MRDGGGREETAASSGDDRSVRERRSVVRRRRTTGENNDVGGEGKHAAQVHLTALLPQPPEVEKVRKYESTNNCLVPETQFSRTSILDLVCNP